VETAHVAAALTSALLHAGWNAAVKRAARPTEVMAAQMLTSALLVLPGLLWTGLPARESWPWLVASTAMNLVTIAALLRSFEQMGYGVAYPVQRAVSVVLVVPASALIAGETPAPAGLAGIGLVVLSLGLLAGGRRRDGVPTARAAAWLLLAGCSAAAYVICDAQGVRAAGSPWAYAFAVSVTNAAAMAWRLRRLGTPWHLMAANWRVGLPTAAAAVASYLLILWVWSQAPVAPAAALRDISAVFAVLIAVAWLKEPFTRRRMLAVLLAAAAVPLLRLA
jgi:drug/metabolite transporter (DMT)-like permease